MVAFVAGVILVFTACAAVLLGASKVHRSIKESRYQSMTSYGMSAQHLHDKHDLHQFGLAQQLRRRLGGLAIFGLSFNTMGLIGSAAIVLGPAVRGGGPAVIGLGQPIFALFALAVSASIAELASAVPKVGKGSHLSLFLFCFRFGTAGCSR
ncbi:amino acid permease [Paenibacillus castaneae]|uniref:hypothetical protein n=1 Tax=Paenibacillus castaneae TaxID=474957 RepID=UPI000C9B5779|nr:hypothetical protein [Paenibacillus castaneae]NIK76692.1 amino acid permease [Paenibacillus castaneae]